MEIETPADTFETATPAPVTMVRGGGRSRMKEYERGDSEMQ